MPGVDYTLVVTRNTRLQMLVYRNCIWKYAPRCGYAVASRSDSSMSSCCKTEIASESRSSWPVSLSLPQPRGPRYLLTFDRTTGVFNQHLLRRIDRETVPFLVDLLAHRIFRVRLALLDFIDPGKQRRRRIV